MTPEPNGPAPVRGARRGRLALVVAAIFLSGLASGFAGSVLLHPRPPPPGGGPPPWLRELRLTDAQRVAAEVIFKRHHDDVDALMRETLPKVRARNEQMEQELAAVLSPEQRQQLEEIRARRPPPPPPPPGGPPGFEGRPPPPPGP
jgi:Spy/CpxP family protein refolding chaperone